MAKVSLKQIRGAVDDKTNWSWNAYPLSWISDYVSWFFANYIPLTPNQISFMWEFIDLIGFGFMAVGGYWNLLIGILIYHFGFLFDYVDGQIARAAKKTSLGGAYLDLLFSWINRSLMMLALGTGLYRSSGNIIYFYLGLAVCLVFLFDNLAKLKVYETLFGKDMIKQIINYRENMRKNARKKDNPGFLGRLKFAASDMIRPFAPFSFLFWTILFNISQYYLILMSIIVPVLFIKNFIKIYIDIGKIKT